MVPKLSNFRILLLKCTGNESALTPVHFNDDVLCNTKLAAMVKRFGLKRSNFLSVYYQWLSKWQWHWKCQFNEHARVKRKAPSFSNLDLNGRFYKYGRSDFLRTFTNGFFDHKKIQDSIKINTVWCKIRYLVRIVIFRTPTDPPHPI